MDRLKMIKGFPEFSHVESVSTVVASLPDSSTLDPSIADDIQQLIFAPDPLTGVPRSDLAISLSKDSRPEIQQYIQQVLQKPLPSSAKSMDGDAVLGMTKSRRESLVEYANRLRELSQPKTE